MGVADGVGLGGDVGVADGVGLNQGVEVADGRGVADSGGILLTVSGLGEAFSSVGVAACRGNWLTGRVTPSSGCSTVCKAAGEGTGELVEGTRSVCLAGVQASTRIIQTTASQCPVLMTLFLLPRFARKITFNHIDVALRGTLGSARCP